MAYLALAAGVGLQELIEPFGASASSAAREGGRGQRLDSSMELSRALEQVQIQGNWAISAILASFRAFVAPVPSVD